MRQLLRRKALWAVLACAGFAVLICGESARNYFGRRQELSRLRQDLEVARRALADEQMQVLRAEKDQAYIESSARRELGLVRGDEIEFRFVAAAREK